MSFEIARRHRFARELAELPDGRGRARAAGRGHLRRDDSILGHRDFTGVGARIEETYRASVAYLDDVEGG